MSFRIVDIMVMMSAVSATLGLKRDLHFDELCAKTTEHLLDHVVWPNTKNLIADFGWDMPIS